MSDKEIGKQENLRFDGVKFFSVNFNILGNSKEDSDIKLDIKPSVNFYHDNANKFDIVYNVKLGIENVFDLSLTGVGYFELSEGVLESENIKEQLIHQNAPAIVFPYIRSFISMLSSNLGTIPTLTIPTHFFKGKLEEYKLD